MGEQPVNKGWGPKGKTATYSIWEFKGGGDCHHFWMRKTYMAKGVTPDAKNPRAEVSVNKAKKKGFKPEKNKSNVAKRPADMDYDGFLPTNKRFQ